MFKSYLKIAIRNLIKHKYFSLVNAIGLAMGMSVSLLVISFYVYVSSFDDFHVQKENIYRIISTLEKGVSREEMASSPAVLAERLRAEYTGISEVVRFNSSFHGDVISERENIPIQGYYTDANFFSVFDFKLIAGNPKTALSQINTIVLTESMARKLSATGDLLGHSIEIEGLGNFEVTGILKDERRTHFWFEALVSFSSLPAKVRGEESSPDQWTDYFNQYVYLLLGSNSKKEDLQRSLDQIANEVYRESKDAKATFKLQALPDITPGLDLENQIGPGDTDYLIFAIFTTIALLILVPACFNYANISIGRALKRSKEIGLRKTMGGLKSHIFLQFITETIAMTIIALAGAVVIFLTIKPEFENLLGGRSLLDLSLTWQMLGAFILFTIAVGFLSGVFPAAYFAGLNPIQVLKGQATAKALTRMGARRVLIVFQFAISFCFIVLLIVFGRQYRYNLNFDFGFSKENMLNVQLQDVDPATFHAEFSKLSSVQDVSMSSGILGLSYSSVIAHDRHRGDSMKVYQIFADPYFSNNMNLKLVAGKNFPEAPQGTERYLVVNEEFLRSRQIASPADGLGMTFVVDGNELEVIGVLKDFHFAPLQEPIRSFFVRNVPARYTYANLKVMSSDIQAARIQMEETWRTLSDKKFEARFLDGELEQAYGFYGTLLKLIGFSGLLAISISLFGLLGMVVYTTETRMKEVGVRRVFGASEKNIAFLLSKDFLKLMLWAAGIAIPISVLLFDSFLSAVQYYRVSLNAWDILAGTTFLFTVGIATTVSQTWKAAAANPVDTLRCE
jgi:putative ABC transport system permease protein